MPFNFAKANPTADLCGLPKTGTMSGRGTQVDHDNGYIHITLAGDHGASDLAISLVNEIASTGRIHPIDQDIARQMIHDAGDSPEPTEQRTVVGTHITVSRKPAPLSND